MISIDLSQYHQYLKIKKEGAKQLLFDPVRRDYFIVQPEELVRQSWIHYLNQEYGIQFKSLSVEKQITVGTLKKRFDLVYYQKGEAQVLFEFKSFNVNISSDTCFQIASYNTDLKVPFLVISNGIEHFAYKIEFKESRVSVLNDLSFL